MAPQDLKVELVPARRTDEATLRNLLSLYLYDFSEIIPIEMDDDGHFDYGDLSEYWDEPGHRAFLIRAGGELAGFVLVDTGSKISGDAETLDVSQFFVLRAWRRRGVGLLAAHATFASFAGTWEVRVLEANRAAQPFWERAVSTWTREFDRFEYTLHDRKQTVYRFRSPAS